MKSSKIKLNNALNEKATSIYYQAVSELSIQ